LGGGARRRDGADRAGQLGDAARDDGVALVQPVEQVGRLSSAQFGDLRGDAVANLFERVGKVAAKVSQLTYGRRFERTQVRKPARQGLRQRADVVDQLGEPVPGLA